MAITRVWQENYLAIFHCHFFVPTKRLTKNGQKQSRLAFLVAHIHLRLNTIFLLKGASPNTPFCVKMIVLALTIQCQANINVVLPGISL